MEPLPDGLFPEPQRFPLRPGDRVSFLTMWGSEECDVVRTLVDKDGWPMVELVTSSGDRITVNLARVKEIS